jgi:hypothetical protein
MTHNGTLCVSLVGMKRQINKRKRSVRFETTGIVFNRIFLPFLSVDSFGHSGIGVQINNRPVFRFVENTDGGERTVLICALDIGHHSFLCQTGRISREVRSDTIG